MNLKSKELKFSDLDPEKYQEYKSRFRTMLGTVGIFGILEVLADISQEFGDGAQFGEPDPFWLNAAAQIEQCKEGIEIKKEFEE